MDDEMLEIRVSETIAVPSFAGRSVVAESALEDFAAAAAQSVLDAQEAASGLSNVLSSAALPEAGGRIKFLHHNTGTTIYQRWPASTYEWRLNLDADGSFTNSRQLFFYRHNPETALNTTQNSFFPWDPRTPAGDDGDVYFRAGSITIESHIEQQSNFSAGTATIVGGAVTAVALTINKTGYQAGQTLNATVGSAPHGGTKAILTFGTRENPPASGIYDIDPASLVITNPGTGYTGSPVVYIQAPWDTLRDLGPVLSLSRNNMGAAHASSGLGYIIFGGPSRISSGALANPFSTVNGSRTVTINHPAHSLASGNRVEYSVGSPAGSGGTPVGGLQVVGTYIITVIDANTYTVQHEKTANATVSASGGNVTFWAGAAVNYGQIGWGIVDPANADPQGRFHIELRRVNGTVGSYYDFQRDFCRIHHGDVRITPDLDNPTTTEPRFWLDSRINTGGSFVSNILATARDTGGGQTSIARLRFYQQTATPGAADGRIQIELTRAGAATTQLDFGDGVTVGAATGGHKGIGTMNFAGDIYKNNTAYTNPDFVLEYAFAGKIEKYAGREGAADYRGRLSLDELNEYIRRNYRLPNVSDEPMGAFARGDKALEKIEELTLDLLEIHKRVKRLERGAVL